jgi:prepilin-type processing-associated H-X9-DG protein
LCPEPCARQGLNKEPACPSRCEEFLQFSSPHAGGVSFAFVDTHAEFLSNSIDVDVLRRQLYPSDDDE